MNLEEIKEQIENDWDSYPKEVQIYLQYLADKNIAYMELIVNIKEKIYFKKYVEAENELAYVIFNGINLNGYADEKRDLI